MTFFQKVLLVIGAVVGALLVWKLAAVLLLLFGAILAATILRAISEPLERRTPLNPSLSLLVAVLAVVSLVGLALFLFGRQVEGQITLLVRILPDAWGSLQLRLSGSPLGAMILERAREYDLANLQLLQRAPSIAFGVVGAVANLFLVVVAGISIAARPRVYREGLLRLFRDGRPRRQAGRALDASAEGLRRWLLGQLFSMTFIGVLTGVGLLAGRRALRLGSGRAGGSGPVRAAGWAGGVSAVPGLLVALAAGPQTVLWALVVYVGVQQVESNLVTPMVLRRMIDLPVAVSLFSVIALAVLLGPLGVVLATPLAVVIFVSVKVLYLSGVLGEDPPDEAPNDGDG